MTGREIEIQGAQFTHAVGAGPGLAVLRRRARPHGRPQPRRGRRGLRRRNHHARRRRRRRRSPAPRWSTGCPGGYGMAVLGFRRRRRRAADRRDARAGWSSRWSTPTRRSWCPVTATPIAALVAARRRQGLFARDIDGRLSRPTPARWTRCTTSCSRLLPHGQFADAPVQFIGSATGDVVAAGHGLRRLLVSATCATPCASTRPSPPLRSRRRRAFVELSAHPALLFAHRRSRRAMAPIEPPPCVGSGRRDEPLVDALSANIAAAAVADPGYRWADSRRRPATAAAGISRTRRCGDTPVGRRQNRCRRSPDLTVADEKWRTRRQSHNARVSARSGRCARSRRAGGALADQLRSAVDSTPAWRRPGPVTPISLVAIAPAARPSRCRRWPPQEISPADRYAGCSTTSTRSAPNCRDVWLVTVGGEHVRADEPVALPAQAALAAMHRSVGFEHPDQTFRHLDLPSWEIDDVTAAAVIDAFSATPRRAALRDDASGPIRCPRAARRPSTRRRLAAGSGLLDNVVITGGSGAVGLHFARYLAERGARRIVLLSRGGVDPRRSRSSAGAHGAEMLAPPCDHHRSAEQVAAAAAEFAGDGASLVIHAAGAATFAGSRSSSPPAAFADTVAAKIAGLARLTELWPLRPDARILLCSSVSGVWGGRGHAAYSAANRMLDVMAGQLRADGRHCVAVRWGLWEGTPDDQASRPPTRSPAIERSGLRPMAPEIAIEASLRDYRQRSVDLGRRPRPAAHLLRQPRRTRRSRDAERDDNRKHRRPRRRWCAPNWPRC